MKRKHNPSGFTLAELLVVIAIIGILAGFLLPVIGTARNSARVAVAGTQLASLETALAAYWSDHGVYPPEIVDRSEKGVDKCSETLYFYLSGMDIKSRDAATHKKLRSARATNKVYLDFKDEMLEDHDNDGYYEAADPWGNPWLYIRGQYPGKPGTSSGMGSAGRPWHNRSKFDLYSLGGEGKTGSTWKVSSDMFRVVVTNTLSYYLQASNEEIDGMEPYCIRNF